MVELIRKDQALNMEIDLDATPEEIELIMKGMQIVFNHIKQLSVIETHRLMHGKWIRHVLKNVNVPWGYDCSVCNKWYIINHDASIEYNFCPNCGAKMDGD